MDKIDRNKDTKTLYNKLDELVEGYDEIMRRLDGLERRMEALSSIAIKGRNEY